MIRTEFKHRKKKCAVKSCRSEFEPRSISHRACCPICAQQLAQDSREKADRKEIKQKLEKFKTRSEYMRDAQIAFNKYIRARAIRFNHSCISSGAPLPVSGTGGGFDAGHYRSIGSAPHLRFNLNNVWGQSKHDNRYGSGAAFEYRRGLIARRGIDVVEALESDNKPRKFTIEYLIRIKKIFSKKASRTSKIVFI